MTDDRPSLGKVIFILKNYFWGDLDLKTMVVTALLLHGENVCTKNTNNCQTKDLYRDLLLCKHLMTCHTMSRVTKHWRGLTSHGICT